MVALAWSVATAVPRHRRQDRGTVPAVLPSAGRRPLRRPGGACRAARGHRRPHRCLPWGPSHRRRRRRDQRDPAGGRHCGSGAAGPGDRVAVEDPCYRPPWRLLRSLGARVTGVPVDDQGLVVEAIPPGIRLVYVTLSHQFPLGMSMSLPRRLALLALAERQQAAILENDYDSEFRAGAAPSSHSRPGPRRPGRLCRLVLQVAAGHLAPGVRGRATFAAPGGARGQVRDRLAHAPCPFREPWPASSARACSPATSASCARSTGPATSRSSTP
jgi:hypothetical protein